MTKSYQDNIKRFFKCMFKGNVCKCSGRIKHIGEDWTGIVWLNIYECNKCGDKYI